MDQTHAVALDIKTASGGNGALYGGFKKSRINALCFVKTPNTRADFGAGAKSCPPKKLPLWLSTRTVSPESAPPLAIALSNIHGWLRSAERSLPSLSRIVFIAGYCRAICFCNRS
jgi:hypothetical protein